MPASTATAAILKAEEKTARTVPASHHRIGRHKAPVAPALAAEVERLTGELAASRDSYARLDRRCDRLAGELNRTRIAVEVLSEMATTATTDARHYRDGMMRARLPDDDFPF